MDHRCGARTPLDLEVSIESQSCGEMRARVRDISIGGMRLEAGADLSVYQPVIIKLSFPRGSPAQRWQAMVVHAANGSAGVMFEFLRTAELQKLIELLRAADAQSRSLAPRSSREARQGPVRAHPSPSGADVESAGTAANGDVVYRKEG